MSPLLTYAIMAALVFSGAGQPPQTQQLEIDPSGQMPAAEESERIDHGYDLHGRLTLPVTVAGEGPYRFVVDTGAERTVIAQELAGRLQLGNGPQVRVYSLIGEAVATTFRIPSLQYGTRQIRDVDAPGFSRANIGADGMLGTDALRSQRVLFDFDRQEVSIAAANAREESWPSNAIVVTARRRDGRLMLVNTFIEGEPVRVIVDTGSQVTIGNSRLRRLLARRRSERAFRPVEINSVTGESLIASYGVIDRLEIGNAIIVGLPMAFADVHAFRELRLDNRPTLLLGMDALRIFKRVSLDFRNRRVRLEMRPPARRSRA